MTALTPLAVTYSLEAPASRNGPLPPTGAPGEPAAVARGRAVPAAMPQHSNPPPESGDPHAPPRARPPARVIDRRSNKCAPRSDTHRSSTTEAMSYPQTQGAPPEYPVTDTYRQQSPRPGGTNDSRDLPTPEVIAICGLSRSTIYEMIGRGEFPAPVKLGARAVGWRRSDIEAWLASRRPAA